MKLQLKELLVRPVSEMMLSKQPVTCQSDVSVAEGIKLLRETHAGCIIVVNGLRVLGIFTERDYLEKIGFTDVDESKKSISAFMTKNPVCHKIHEPIGLALLKMRQGHFRHIVIVDGYGNLQSVVNMGEIMEYLFSTVTDVLYGTDKKAGVEGY